MHVVSRAIRPLAALAALMLVFGTLADANHAWSTYHWGRTSNPVALKIGDNLTNGWSSYLVTAKNDWDQSAVLSLSIVAGGARTKQCRPTTGRIEVCNGAYGQNGWLGLAQIWLSGGHIVQAVTKVNDTYFALAQYNNTAEKLHVMCQEVGHDFGLGHQDESGISLNTCMDYYHNTSNSDTKSTHPNQHDYDQLAAIYAHLDSVNTAQATPVAGSPQWVGGADEHGTPAGASPGLGRYYAQDLGGGRILLTHVYWADGRERAE